MDEKKSYKFKNDIKCFQEQLSLRQDKELISVFAKTNLENYSQLSVLDVIVLISKENIIEDFLKIILQSDQELDVDKLMNLKNSELKEIVEDFFTLNPLAKDISKILSIAAELTNQTLTSKSIDSNLKADSTEK